MGTSLTPPSLASFLPRIQLQKLAASPNGPAGPTQERIEAAAMVVDLSNFTRLTERFAARGSIGAEQLSGFLNSYFGRTSESVAEYGGDVLFFAGDSILAVWPSEGDMPRAVGWAAQCALAVQKQALHADVESSELSRHIAIGAGSLSIMELGGVDGRWQTLFAGESIRQLSVALPLAKAGQVVLTPEAWRHARSFSRGEAAGEHAVLMAVDMAPPPPGSRHPAPDPGFAARIKGCVPDVLVERLKAGRADWVAEFRNVTVVFANLPGIDVDDPRSISALQIAIATMQSELLRYESTLYQFLMDEKGVSMLAASGLPSSAHEDDALRALQAALSIREGLELARIPSSIGVASGPVFCGICGNETRRQYSIVGSTINLAARLMQAHTNDIVCDEATANAVRQRLRFEALPEVRVKGRPEPIRVWRVGRTRSGSGVFRPPSEVATRRRAFMSSLLGRDSERRQLGLKLLDLGGRRGSLSVVLGEAGIGKSHLLFDLAEKARALDVSVLAGQGDAIEQSTRYYAFRPVLKQILDPTGQAARESLRGEVERLLNGDARLQSWAPLLNEILPMGLPDNDAVEQMSSSARADCTRDVFIHLLRKRLQAGPSLLILDDVHWCDSSSLRLISSIIRRHPELMVVLASRPGDSLTDSLRELIDLAGAETIKLETLPFESIREIVTQRLGKRDVDEAVMKLIWETAEGHPLYSEELTLELRDSGMVEFAGGKCRLVTAANGSQSVSLPASLKGIITGRFDRLPLDVQLALKTASVIGRVFPVRMLHDNYPGGVDPALLDRQLGHLERTEIIRIERLGGDPVYSFKHVITRDVAYETMLFAQRQPLHRSVAQWIEKHHQQELDAHYTILAHHYERAGDVSKSVGYLEKAGEQAVHNFSNREAVRVLNKASSLAEQEKMPIDSERRARWERSLGEAHLKLADYEAARTHLNRSLELRGLRAPSSRSAVLLDLATGACRQFLYRNVSGARQVSNAETGRRREEASASMRLGEVSLFHNDALGMLASVVRGLNAAEIARSAPEMINGFGALGIVVSMLGFHRVARSYIDRTLALTGLDISPYDRAYAFELVSVYSISIGDWELLDHACKHAEEGFRQVGDRFRWETGRALRGYGRLLRGAFAEAHDAFEDVHVSAQSDGAVQTRVWARAGQLAGSLATRSIDVSCLEELEELSRRNPHPTEAILALGMLAAARLQRGEDEMALERADRALEIVASTTPTVYYLKWPIYGIAEVYLHEWKKAKSENQPSMDGFRRKAQAAAAVLRSLAFMNPVARPGSYLVSARIAWLNGKKTTAQRLVRKSIGSAERLGMLYEEGLACHVLAGYLQQQ